MKNLSKIGVLGGAFNPPHCGHLLIAKKAIKELGLKKIILMVTGKPALKKNDLAPIKERMAMAKILTSYNHRLEISDLEVKKAKKGKTSYTTETIRDLQKKHPLTEIYWLIGEDSLQEILQGKWRGGLSIFNQAKFIVFQRPGIKVKIPKNIFKKIKIIKLNVPISSTEIREKIKNGKDVSKMVPKKILGYIKKKKLYL